MHARHCVILSAAHVDGHAASEPLMWSASFKNFSIRLPVRCAACECQVVLDKNACQDNNCSILRMSAASMITSPSALHMCSLEFSMAVRLGNAACMLMVHTCWRLIPVTLQQLACFPTGKYVSVSPVNCDFSAGCGMLSTAAALCFASKLLGMCQSSKRL